jgi:O-antigen ligase
LVAAISIIYSVDRYLTLKESMILVANIMAFYMLVGFLSSAHRIRLFIAVLISAGLSVSLLGLLQYFFVYKVILKDFVPYILSAVSEHMISLKRIGSCFGWPNVLAGFLMLILPLSFVCTFTVVNKRERYYATVITLVISLAMLFTYSITAWVSLIFAALASAILLLKSEKIRPSRLTIFIISAISVLIALIIMNKRRTPFTGYSFSSRIMFLKSALLMIKDHPFLGRGLGTFGVVNPNYISLPEGFSRYAHNAYLQVWAETGIIGLLPFISVIWLVLKKAVYGLRSCRDREARLLLAGLLCGIISFLLDNANSFTMLIANVSLFWWVIVAVMIACTKKFI